MAIDSSAVVTSEFDPSIWYSIDRAGIVTVNIIRAEMGQHVGTALARILADELEADWNKVRIDAVDSNPKWGFRGNLLAAQAGASVQSITSTRLAC